MNLIPLRTAAIAGACAVALSFVSLPAHAVTMIPSDDGTSTSSTTDSGTVPTDDSTLPTDDSAGMDDGTSNDSSADDVTDDDGSDVSDDDGTDSSDDGTATDAPVVALPAEKGHPKADFALTVFTPKQIATKGIEVEYTGLTAGASYQPYYSTGQSGGELTDVKKASKKGTIRFTYKLSKAEKKSFGALGSVYTIGLLGLDTDLRLDQTVSVKYDSDLSWKPAERHGGKVTLSVAVDKDDAAGRSADWKKASVTFEKKVGTKWVAVKTVKTNRHGLATATVKAGKTAFRAVLKTSRTVIGGTTAGHRK